MNDVKSVGSGSSFKEQADVAVVIARQVQNHVFANDARAIVR